MVVPYHLHCGSYPQKADPHSWEYTRKVLYPYHAEFWPEDVAEHVYYEQQARLLRQRHQKEWCLSILRLQWLKALKPLGRRLLHPGSFFENPLRHRSGCNGKRAV
ncbi:hypothetical protein ABLO27_11460 [Roseibium sp. SCPC15]|uniref:hypothetical protein n=1 Tax=Roseibium sp. SCP15 TaxID=3141376 RepID=UPI003337DC4B